ncbi:MAG: HlyC/CorC family transporter [Proteobacteria bacterium]|nr:HlyC/CorC family transporter [Pseudomonadota bacterium]
MSSPSPANPESGGAPASVEDPDKQGPLDAILASVGLRRKGRGEGRPADEVAAHGQAGSDLVDQAEAFQTLRVGDVMTPRADVTAVEISQSFEEVVAAFAETEHSRLPVYRETLDDPVGVVHLKDVFKLMADGAHRPPPNDPVIHRVRRETLYVPPSMRAADLLVRMQASRIHLAMVIDEFGGVDGLVTMEDLIEAVVGEIDDEHDEASAAQIVARAGGVFEVEARAALDEVEAAVGLPLGTEDLEGEDIETVAGLVTALAGRVPQRGEVISHPAGLEFEVVDADPRRVKRLRIRPATPPPDPNPAADV